MTRCQDLILRNVEVDGRAGLDVRIRNGFVAEIGAGLPPSANEHDGAGGALIPGLMDHHIHLLGLAAQRASVVLDDVSCRRELADLLTRVLAQHPPGAWIRAIGYHESIAGELTRAELDALAPHHKLRVQHRTGALWMLSSLALESLQAGEDTAFCIERDERGRPTGRLWRGDAWLRARLPAQPPDLAPIGSQLAAYGITSVTDASATTDAQAARVLGAAVADGSLPVRLMLMSAGELGRPVDSAFAVGPVKVLLDDHALPGLSDFIATIERARRWNRHVAVHCVTAGELALTLAAFDAAGALPGDRIEHGGVIPFEAIARIRGMGLTVVTQPAFVAERGDRYLADVDPAEQDDLYRCGTLLAAGIPVLGSSDAPYAAFDPWAAMRAAVARKTVRGATLGAHERVTARQALNLYLGSRVEAGAPADLCLMKAPLRDVLNTLRAEMVQATWRGGVRSGQSKAEQAPRQRIGNFQ